MGSDSDNHAIDQFRRHGGLLRTREALALGIHPRTLYRLRDAGVLEQVVRGVYSLGSMTSLTHPDLVTVALRVPRAVVCLVSALAYHDATDEVPHEVQIALPRGTRTPRLEFPPVRVFRFSGDALTEGLQDICIDGVNVRMYDLPKTVTDCFRFRNRIGLDVAVDAMRQAVREKGVRPSEILRYARMCRMERVMLPYLEAIQ